MPHLSIMVSAVNAIERRLDRNAFDDALSLGATIRRRTIITEVVEAMMLADRDGEITFFDEGGDPSRPGVR